MTTDKAKTCFDCLHCKVSAKSTEKFRLCFCAETKKKAKLQSQQKNLDCVSVQRQRKKPNTKSLTGLRKKFAENLRICAHE